MRVGDGRKCRREMAIHLGMLSSNEQRTSTYVYLVCALRCQYNFINLLCAYLFDIVMNYFAYFFQMKWPIVVMNTIKLCLSNNGYMRQNETMNL